MIDYLLLHPSVLATIALGGLFCGGSALGLALYTFFRQQKTLRKIIAMFRGKEARDLESLMVEHSDQLTQLDHEIGELYKISNRVHKLALGGMHKSALKRFNPFGDLGGNQSFSLALLDGHHDGLVISALHTREGTRIYAKAVAAGATTGSDLTDEERDVIGAAVRQTK